MHHQGLGDRMKMTKKEFRDAVLRARGKRQTEKRLLVSKKKLENVEIIAYLKQQKGDKKLELTPFTQGFKRKEELIEEEN